MWLKFSLRLFTISVLMSFDLYSKTLLSCVEINGSNVGLEFSLGA